MNSIQIYVPIVATLIFIGINIELIKREKLNEKFGTFWITVNLVMLMLVLNIDILYKIAAFFQTQNIASLSYSLAIFFLLLLGLFFFRQYVFSRKTNKKFKPAHSLLDEKDRRSRKTHRSVFVLKLRCGFSLLKEQVPSQRF